MLLQQLVNGLTLGAVYTLIALSFSLVMGILGVLNLAIAELFDEIFATPRLDRFDELMGLFNSIWGQRAMVLLSIPGTTVRAAKSGDNLTEGLEGSYIVGRLDHS